MSSINITTVDGASSGRPSSVAVGSTVAVAAEITWSDGTKESKLTDDERLTWHSSDTSKATVAGGVITGVAAGTVDITVSIGDVTSEPLSSTVTTE